MSAHLTGSKDAAAASARREEVLGVSARSQGIPLHARPFLGDNPPVWVEAQIAQHLDRTPAAVAGVLKRGLSWLREILEEK